MKYHLSTWQKNMADNCEEIKENESGQKSQKKVETAIKFLKNPKVRETPLAQRKAFLVTKGLTEDEIEQAINVAETTDSLQHVVSQSRNPTQDQNVFPGQPQYSLRLRDFFWVALVGGSFGYLLAHLVKSFLLPYILNQKDGSDEKIEQLQTSVVELKENLSGTVNGIQDALDSVQKMLQDQQQKVQTMSVNLSTPQASLSKSASESFSLTEIKSEISSLKGLLLNSRQFPSPVVQSSPFPCIPAWQRSAGTQSNEDAGVETDNALDTINEEDTWSGTLELPSADACGLKTTENTTDIEKSNSAQYSCISTT